MFLLRHRKKSYQPHTGRFRQRGQATAELAIMGSIVIILLAYLLQQGFLYNTRQSLEMYTFREALQLSRGQLNDGRNRGIFLTVIRDVIIPSFFSGINRQRLMASASVDYNPWILWNPEEDTPEHTPTQQLIQVGEAMIRNGLFFEVPPTKITMHTKKADEPQTFWANSAISELDSQIGVVEKTSNYAYRTAVRENQRNKTVTKSLQSTDTIPTVITFEDKNGIIKNYIEDDLEGDIEKIEVAENTIPADIDLRLDELVRRTKTTSTPH